MTRLVLSGVITNSLNEDTATMVVYLWKAYNIPGVEPEANTNSVLTYLENQFCLSPNAKYN